MFLRTSTLLLFLICAANVFAQNTQCSLTLSDLTNAPELFGFRIGMTTDQIKARVPQVVFGRVNEFGLSKTSMNPDFDPRIDKSTFSGVRTVSLDFLDGRVTSVWLGYDSSFKWQTVPDFVKGISQSLHLPDAWKPWKSRGQQLSCADFHATVSIVAEGPSFHLVDETAERSLLARREAKEEAAASDADSSAEIIADRERKVYYAEDCRPVSEMKETNRVVFQTRDEAEKAGYKPATKCE